MTTIYKAFGFVVTVIILVLATKPFLNIMDKKFGKKITLPSFSGSSSSSNKAPQTSKPGNLLHPQPSAHWTRFKWKIRVVS